EDNEIFDELFDELCENKDFEDGSLLKTGKLLRLEEIECNDVLLPSYYNYYVICLFFDIGEIFSLLIQAIYGIGILASLDAVDVDKLSKSEDEDISDDYKETGS
ncbi:MAG: hypothetical protein EZS28_047192, partial [Streblomastix strix]